MYTNHKYDIKKENILKINCVCVMLLLSKNIDTKQSNKRNNQKTRPSHEIRRHKWQDNMNQRWNQVLWKGKHFLLRMRHPWWCPLCRIKKRNVLMTTISWPTDVIECQITLPV